MINKEYLPYAAIHICKSHISAPQTKTCQRVWLLHRTLTKSRVGKGEFHP